MGHTPHRAARLVVGHLTIFTGEQSLAAANRKGRDSMSDGTPNMTIPGLEITSSGAKAPAFPALRLELTPEAGIRVPAQKSLTSLLPEAGVPERPSSIFSTRDSAFAETREIASRALDAAVAAGAPPATVAASVTQYKDASIWAASENLLDDMQADLETGATKAMNSDKNTPKYGVKNTWSEPSAGVAVGVTAGSAAKSAAGTAAGDMWGRDDALSQTDRSRLPESEGRLVNRRA